MYKLLLSWRYLRSRWIALASIISVTLGVATLVIVNAVMAGFTEEMHKRLNGMMSDIVFESIGLDGFPDADAHIAEIRRVLGDDLKGATATVTVPAMLSFQFRGQWVPRHVTLIGIDEQTYSSVGDFQQYLLHPDNREKLSFDLHESGYDERMGTAGWEYRRIQEAAQKAYDEQTARIEEIRRAQEAEPSGAAPPSDPGYAGGPLPVDAALPADPSRPSDPSMPTDPTLGGDPSNPTGIQETEVFDGTKDQFTGVILGFTLASMRHRTPDGKTMDTFLCRPGDNVKLTFPTAGESPTAANSYFTIVDVYESKMSEYDSTLVFVPLRELQKARGMIRSGVPYSTAIQLKLNEGVKLEDARDRLRARFPVAQYAYRIQTWKELQGPLLAAVQMETMILNILLFLIIAVAGFGILATFFMIVVEKTKDIGVMKALGAPSRGVMAIFLNYGLALGAAGSLSGMVLGVLFVININYISAGLEWLTGREVFDATIYYFDQIPAVIQPLTIFWVVLGSIFIAVMASVLPALRAARLHPVEALRYE